MKEIRRQVRSADLGTKKDKKRKLNKDTQKWMSKIEKDFNITII